MADEAFDKRLSGLQRIAKIYGGMVINGKRWVWDYATDEAVPEEQMPVKSERWVASERAKYGFLPDGAGGDPRPHTPLDETQRLPSTNGEP